MEEFQKRVEDLSQSFSVNENYVGFYHKRLWYAENAQPRNIPLMKIVSRFFYRIKHLDIMHRGLLSLQLALHDNEDFYLKRRNERIARLLTEEEEEHELKDRKKQMKSRPMQR